MMQDHILPLNENFRLHSVWDDHSEVVLTLDRNDEGRPDSVYEWVMSRTLGLRVNSLLNAEIFDNNAAGIDHGDKEMFASIVDACIDLAAAIIPRRDSAANIAWSKFDSDGNVIASGKITETPSERMQRLMQRVSTLVRVNSPISMEDIAEHLDISSEDVRAIVWRLIDKQEVKFTMNSYVAIEE